MFKKIILAASIINIVIGCTVTSIPTATGGSKSDGFIELSYTVKAFENSIINWERATKIAVRKCKAWKYNSAESFGGIKSKCENKDIYNNCSLTRVYAKYQCTK